MGLAEKADLVGVIGQNVIFFCINYICMGKIVEIEWDRVKLEKDAQLLSKKYFYIAGTSIIKARASIIGFDY